MTDLLLVLLLVGLICLSFAGAVMAGVAAFFSLLRGIEERRQWRRDYTVNVAPVIWGGDLEAAARGDD